MKTKRYLSLNHEMCERAILEAFDKKWFRRDYLATVEKYGGVSRAQLSSAARVNDWNPRLEAVNGIALEMEQRIEDLLDGETDDLDLDPVSVFYRIDGISMKRRELSNCCPMHQAFGGTWTSPVASGKTVAVSICQYSRQGTNRFEASSRALASQKKSWHTVCNKAGCAGGIRPHKTGTCDEDPAERNPGSNMASGCCQMSFSNGSG